MSGMFPDWLGGGDGEIIMVSAFDVAVVDSAIAVDVQEPGAVEIIIDDAPIRVEVMDK